MIIKFKIFESYHDTDNLSDVEWKDKINDKDYIVYLFEECIPEQRFDEIKKFIEHGGDVNITHYNYNFLSEILVTSSIEFIRPYIKSFINYLFEMGIDKNYKGVYNMNYLNIAVDENKYDFLDILIEHDINWNNEDDDGEDFLIYLKYVNITEYNRIIKKYPDKYEKYMRYKKLDKFNI